MDIMTDNEKLIEEAAATIAVAELVRTHRTWGDLIETQKDEYRRVARATLAVFEKAHTPTDDEREALAEVIEVLDTHGQWPVDQIAGAVLAAGFRRSEVVPEPSVDHAYRGNRSQDTCWVDVDGEICRKPVEAHSPEPQGEPSDAQVQAEEDLACRHCADPIEWENGRYWHTRSGGERRQAGVPMCADPQPNPVRKVAEAILTAIGGIVPDELESMHMDAARAALRAAGIAGGVR